MAERYTLAQASDINSVFSRLEQLRRAHYEGAGQTAEGKNALASAFQTAPVVQTSTIEEPYTLMKSYLNALRKSVFLTTVTEEQINDVPYGYSMAKEMGKLDVGQSVVVKDKMMMAVEAIEGTDKCIQRGGKIAKKGGVIVKVAKPSQDKRFDIPAVGLKTLKTMKKYKLSVLALEANETIIVDMDEVVKFADKNNIVIMAV